METFERLLYDELRACLSFVILQWETHEGEVSPSTIRRGREILAKAAAHADRLDETKRREVLS